MESLPQTGELAPAAPEIAPLPPAPAASQPSAAMPSIPLPVPPAAAPTALPATPAPVSASSPAVADDADLIEKEWVQRAKQIVEQTRTDPYLQNRELSAFKADYLQKRYNKTIKLGE